MYVRITVPTLLGAITALVMMGILSLKSMAALLMVLFLCCCDNSVLPFYLLPLSLALFLSSMLSLPLSRSSSILALY